jgi:hypothetical protein
MGLETRKGSGGCYYTRSRRVHGRVTREYCGSGAAALLQAMMVEEERDARATRAAMVHAEEDRLNALDAPVDVLCNVVDALVRRSLQAAGFHQHQRGPWRKRRDVHRND